jgi:hypothetical protein
MTLSSLATVLAKVTPSRRWLVSRNFSDSTFSMIRYHPDTNIVGVDGANVAYYGFPELHYSQVKLVVDELKRMGETPLVVLPKKYTYRTFMLSHSGKSQTLGDRDFEVLQRYAVSKFFTATYIVNTNGTRIQLGSRRNNVHSASTLLGRLLLDVGERF